MRHWLLLVLILPLAHCSCQRDAGGDAPATAAADGANAPRPAAISGESPDAPSPVAAQAASSAALQATSALHAYLGALPGPERAIADAYWAGGNPGSPAGDAALRDVPGLRAMRIDNDTPRPLDRQSPPAAFEIPLKLRLDTDAGPYRLQGFYRLRARIDGQGWEITSAELQPVLD